ncbi:AcrR family transcriptional regulator [Spinactinospora alkalitolerans]|uniref:AcrR family transcriptional regulator n=1 Tax=Spinactinospora alkalitolerans TaxID=687207 RepID=A0A852TS51_9ACTN|nr:TetR/AcrR family transcriptional regulator [Spinactinospora alkalitolerans]NYE46778.1 AcrR family transcriptional regulator [Spinactinospora alkalitolerans]
MPKQAISGRAEEKAGPAPRPSRRERVREATLREIKGIARLHLIEQGLPGVSLRAIAREMGMTAPGLYRYYAGLDDLLQSLRADFFDELSEAVGDADRALPADDVDGRILGSLRAFRSWALANRAEFTLLFGPPSPHRRDPDEGVAAEAGQRFAATFFTLFDELLRQRRFTPPPDEELSPALCRQLEHFAEHTGFLADSASHGALRVLMACWVRLYGLVCMEVFDHLAFVMDDMEPLFEAEVREILTTAGVEYRPPG